ncbi:MAG: hypothetical protein ACI86M_001267 [Saprospiraceae bacterium]
MIINILEDEALITFDFDDCSAFVQTMSNGGYSEFTPYYHSELESGRVTSSNILLQSTGKYIIRLTSQDTSLLGKIIIPN